MTDTWTAFWLDAEYERFGLHRLLKFHNDTVKQRDALRAENERLRQEHTLTTVVSPVGGPVSAPCAIEGCRYHVLAAENERLKAEVKRSWEALGLVEHPAGAVLSGCVRLTHERAVAYKHKADAWDRLREWLRSDRAPESTYLVLAKMADLEAHDER